MPGADRPLLTPSARRLAAWLITVCAVVTAVVGAHVAHQAHATWPDTVIDPWVQATLGYNHVTKDLRNLGGPASVAGYCVALTVGCLLARRYRAALLAALSVPLASGITESALKPLVGRTMLDFLSYPSGHVTGASAFAAALVVILAGPSAPPLPAWVRWAAAVLAGAAVLMVAAAMVALLDHYATDTIGGAAVGTGTVLAVALGIDTGAVALARRRAAGRPRNQPDAAPVDSLPVQGRRGLLVGERRRRRARGRRVEL